MASTDGLPRKALLRPDEVAQALNVSIRTVFNYRQDGRLKEVKITKKTVRIDRASVEMILKNSS
jgi:excisionase family DNA binding protein